MFELIECYAKGDKKQFFEMVKNKKGELDQKDFELILLNVTRLFPNSTGIDTGDYQLHQNFAS